MAKKNKMLQIWTLAISALWIITLSESKINSLKTDENFKLVNTSFADDDDETWNFLDSILNTSSITNSWLTNTWTNNCKTVYETTYNTVYDTVTSASGTKSQVPRQVAVQTPHQVCDNSWITNTLTTDTNLVNTWTLNNAITASKLFKAPNSKVYSLINNDWIVSIKKSDWTYSSKTFSSYDEAKNYLNQNAVPAPEVYKAPNGKNYTIMFENWKIEVKRPDFSYLNKTFTSYNEARTYLDKNALPPKVVAKPIIKKTVAKVITTAKKTTTLNTNVTKKVVSKPVVTASKPVVTKPVVSTPKVDTTTKAS